MENKAIELVIENETYYLHYTICDAMPGADEFGVKEPQWKALTTDESFALMQIPMDGDVIARCALEIPVLQGDYQFNFVRVLCQKSDNNGCTVFACKDKQVLDTIVSYEGECYNDSYRCMLEK